MPASTLGGRTHVRRRYLECHSEFAYGRTKKRAQSEVQRRHAHRFGVGRARFAGNCERQGGWKQRLLADLDHDTDADDAGIYRRDRWRQDLRQRESGRVWLVSVLGSSWLISQDLMRSKRAAPAALFLGHRDPVFAMSAPRSSRVGMVQSTMAAAALLDATQCVGQGRSCILRRKTCLIGPAPAKKRGTSQFRSTGKA